MGLPDNLSPKICFGPTDLGRILMKHAYTESGIKKLVLFIRHWRTDSQAGRLSRVLLAWVQALAGTSFSVLRHPSVVLPHLAEAVEISYLRTYLTRASGHLVLDEDYVVPLQRSRDSHLMDAVLSSAQCTPAEICLSQYYSLYLKVHTLSEITDPTGTSRKASERAGARAGTRFLSSSTRLIPMLQAHPNARAWRTWRFALSLWVTETDALTHPLGDWTVLPKAQRFRWTWYSCGISLYTSHDNQFRRFSPIRSRRNYYDYLPLGFVTITQLPVLACRCDVMVFDEIIRRPQSPTSRAHIPSITILPSAPDFPAYLLRLPDWKRYLIEHVTSDLAFEDIVDFLQEYGGVGVSEGSSARHRGSFGWALASPEGQRLAKCSGLVYGQDPSSYRSPCGSPFCASSTNLLRCHV
jgi:hypothetical protein